MGYHCTRDLYDYLVGGRKKAHWLSVKSILRNKKNQTQNHKCFHPSTFVVVFTEDLQSSIELISFYPSNLKMEAIPQSRFSCLLQLFILRWWEKAAVAALVARSNSWYFLLLKGLPRTEIHGALVAQKTQKSVWAAVTAMNIVQICKMLLCVAKIFHGFGTS